MMSFSSSSHIAILTPNPDLSHWFFQDIGCAEEDGIHSLNYLNRQLAFHTYSEETSFKEDSTPEQIDLFVGILRYVDILAFQKMDQLLAASGALSSAPTLLLLYRNENESDFKMSCPYCGQKLWVRDADKDKRGRCPHCSKGFTLPDQEDHVRSSLRLPDTVKIKKIIRHDPGSFAAPLREMIRTSSTESTLSMLDKRAIHYNQETMKVSISDEDTP